MTAPAPASYDAVMKAIHTRRWTDVEHSLTDLTSVSALAEAVGPDRLAGVYDEAYASGYQGAPLAIISRAIRRASPMVRTHPEMLAAQIHLQLRGCGDPVVEPLVRAASEATEPARARVASATASARRARLVGHDGWITAVAVLPDGTRAVTASSDYTARVWDLGARRGVAVLEGHIGEVTAVVVVPDRPEAISASTDMTLKLWDLTGGRELAPLVGHESDAWCIAVSPDARLVASGSADGVIIVWDLGARREVARFAHSSECVNALAWIDRGRLASAGHDGTTRVWDVAAGTQACVLEGHSRAVLALATTPGGHRVISGSSDSTIRIWDPAQGVIVRVIGSPTDNDPLVELSPVAPPGRAGHWRAVNGLAVDGNGRRLVSASSDGTIRTWDLESGEQRGSAEPDEGVVWCVAFAPHGTTALSGAHDGGLSWWDLGVIERNERSAG